MRLLHTRMITFKDFFDDQIPRYAILSHRWSEEEVSYQTFPHERDHALEHGNAGYGWTKILKACQIARSSHPSPLNWIWIDTCCIDKSSSAELSEAINSMYQWYKNSKICYVFLPDVHDAEAHSSRWEGTETFSAPQATGHITVLFYIKQLMISTWFRRAWTLQELLAPTHLTFYNAEFDSIGTNFDLADILAEASKIPVEFLADKDLNSTSVAHRMRWAAHRQASRREDAAYSLLGIFGINMPLLYGEGETRAFRRLQKEIIASCPDESIFCWTRPEMTSATPVAMLAPNITSFASDFPLQLSNAQLRTHNEVTSRGVRINMVMAHTDRPSIGRRLVVPLNCFNPRLQHRQLSHYAIMIEVMNSALLMEKAAMIQGRRVGELLVGGNNPEYRGPTKPAPPKIWRSTQDYYLQIDSKSIAEMRTVVETNDMYQRGTVDCQIYIDT